MSDLIPRNDDPISPTAMSRTEFKPSRPIQNRNGFLRFMDGVRQFVSGYCMDMSGRWAESQVAKEEAIARKTHGLELDNESKDIDNQVKLWEARKKFEAAQLPEQQPKLTEVGTAQQPESNSGLEVIGDPVLASYVAKLRSLSRDEVRAEVLRLVEYIADNGGAVEIGAVEEVLGTSFATTASHGSLSPEGARSRNLVRMRFPDAISMILDVSIMPLMAENPNRGDVWAIYSDEFGSHLGEGSSEDEAWQEALQNLPASEE